MPDGAGISFGTDDSPTYGSVHHIHPWQTDGKQITVLPSAGHQGGSDCWAPFSPDAKYLIAVCGPWILVPLDDPTKARPLPIPDGATQVDWQRIVLFLIAARS